jgi:hypothetical protein
MKPAFMHKMAIHIQQVRAILACDDNMRSPDLIEQPFCGVLLCHLTSPDPKLRSSPLEWRQACRVQALIFDQIGIIYKTFKALS